MRPVGARGLLMVPETLSYAERTLAKGSALTTAPLHRLDGVRTG